MHQGWWDELSYGTSECRARVVKTHAGDWLEQKSNPISTDINSVISARLTDPWTWRGKGSDDANEFDSSESIAGTAPAGMNCSNKYSLAPWKDVLPMPLQRDSFEQWQRDQCNPRLRDQLSRSSMNQWWWSGKAWERCDKPQVGSQAGSPGIHKSFSASA